MKVERPLEARAVVLQVLRAVQGARRRAAPAERPQVDLPARVPVVARHLAAVAVDRVLADPEAYLTKLRLATRRTAKRARHELPRLGPKPRREPPATTGFAAGVPEDIVRHRAPL